MRREYGPHPSLRGGMPHFLPIHPLDFIPSGKRQGRHKQTGIFVLPEMALCLSFEQEKMLPSVKPSVVTGNGRSQP